MTNGESFAAGAQPVPPTPETRASFDEVIDTLKLQAQPGGMDFFHTGGQLKEPGERRSVFQAHVWSLESGDAPPFYAVDMSMMLGSGLTVGQDFHGPTLAAGLIEDIATQCRREGNKRGEFAVRKLYRAAMYGEITGIGYRTLRDMLKVDVGTYAGAGLSRQYADGSRVVAMFSSEPAGDNDGARPEEEWVADKIELLTGRDEAGFRSYYNYRRFTKGIEVLKSVQDRPMPRHGKAYERLGRIDVPRVEVVQGDVIFLRNSPSEERLAEFTVALRNALNVGEAPQARHSPARRFLDWLTG